MIDALIGWTLPVATLAALAGVSRWRVRPAGSGATARGPLASHDAPLGGQDRRGGHDGPGHDGRGHDAAGDGARSPAPGRHRPAAVTVLKASRRPVRHELRPLAGGLPVPLPPSVPLEVGRAAGSGLPLDAPSVSWRHARLRRIGGEGVDAVLEDCDSTNGTTVNGGRIVGAVTLVPGDVVRFGGPDGPAYEYQRVAIWSALPTEVTA